MAEYRRDHGSATNAAHNEPRATFIVPTQATDAQGDDGGEADRLEEEDAEEHC